MLVFAIKSKLYFIQRYKLYYTLLILLCNFEISRYGFNLEEGLMECCVTDLHN